MNKRYCIDASALIDFWDETHPESIFPTLWEILANHNKNIILIKPIYDELEPPEKPKPESIKKSNPVLKNG